MGLFCQRNNSCNIHSFIHCSDDFIVRAISIMQFHGRRTNDNKLGLAQVHCCCWSVRSAESRKSNMVAEDEL
jgi:hypothetical protein